MRNSREGGSCRPNSNSAPLYDAIIWCNHVILDWRPNEEYVQVFRCSAFGNSGRDAFRDLYTSKRLQSYDGRWYKCWFLLYFSIKGISWNVSWTYGTKSVPLLRRGTPCDHSWWSMWCSLDTAWSFKRNLHVGFYMVWGMIYPVHSTRWLYSS